MADRRTEWGDLADADALAACVRESAPDVYGYLGLLAGHDRGAAEAAALDLYRALGTEVAAGDLDTVTLSRLRTAARRLWLDRTRRELADTWPPVDLRPVATLAELSLLERTVVVLRVINRMSVERAADALALTPGWVGDVEQRAVRRLGGDVGRGLAPWFGDEIRARPGLVDELVVAALDPTAPSPPLDETLAIDAITPDTPDVPGTPDETHADDEHADDEHADRARAEPPLPEAPVADDVPTPDEPHADGSPVGPVGDDDADASDGGPATMPTPVVVGAGSAGADDTGSGDPVTDGSKRRRGLVAAAVVAIVAIVAAGAIWVGSRDDSEAAETTTPTSSAPVTAAATVDQFAPACIERSEPTAAVPAPAVATFGPVGAEPALAITLPVWRDAGGDAQVDAQAVVAGGTVLVTMRAPASATTPASIVAAVDLDGTVRWVRCLGEPVEVRAAPGATPGAAIRGSGAWLALDPATGEVGGAVAEPPLPSGPVLPAPAWPDPTLTPVAWDGFTSAVDGDIALVLGCSAPDPDDVQECTAPVLRGYALSGVAPVPPTTAPAGTTAPPAVTVPTVAPAPGASPLLLWQRVDVTDVIAVRDGFALIQYAPGGGEGSWYLVRTDTGVAVDGQAWGPDRFPASCCADDTSVRVDGGVLLVRDGDQLVVWRPAADAATGATAPVAIP